VADPASMPPSRPDAAGDHRSILERWSITPGELTRIVDENPSLRGILFGYVAELKLTALLEANAHVSASMKYDDHDRTKKGDRVIEYKGHRFIVESKSLQTNSIRRRGDGWIGKAQVDASDRRTVRFADGSTLQTTLLLLGEFDVLAVNCFAFENTWRWVFCRNSDLPCSTFRKYTPEQRGALIASLVAVAWPPEPPFKENIFDVLDGLVREHSTGDAPPSA
jgi:hypothetical protein